VNPAQLFEQHKTAVLAVAAAGVAGLALFHRKKAGGDTAGASAGATIPAAAVVPGGGSYDSSAYDVYSALQSQLTPLLEQAQKSTGGKTGDGITTAPTPATSPLFKAGYFRVLGSNRTYYQDTAGNLDWISKAEGDVLRKAAGKKGLAITDVSKDATFWDGRRYLDAVGSNVPKPPGTPKK
jgi:hypothetical protein